MIAEQSELDSVIEAINKGRIYKYIVRPSTDNQVQTIVKEASELYQLRTELENRVSEFSDQLIQAELNLESLIEDIQASERLDAKTKFDYITRLKSTITLLSPPD